MRHRGRRRDRVHGADLHARGQHAQCERGIAVDHDLRLGGLDGRDGELDVEVVLSPGEPGVEQALVGLDDLAVLLLQREGHLLAPQLDIEAVDAAQHAQHEHVLALAGVGHELQALALQRDLDDAVPVLPQAAEGLGIHGADAGVAVLAPHALQQDDAAALQLTAADAPEQDLFVEGNHQVSLVAAVVDGFRSEPDAVAAGTGDAACRRLDLGRNDLDRPDAVAHPGGDRAQRLAAALCALAGVADDLHDVLADPDGLLRRL
jgi:hypothetical protein